MVAFLRFLFVIPFGFVLACFAGAFALLWPFLRVDRDTLGDPLALFHLALGFTAQAAQVGGTALLPWGVFMAVSETAGLSSILLHAAAGLLGGFAASRLGPGAPAHLSVQTALIVSGLAFALVYWLVAGRAAGRWRKAYRRAPDPVRP